MTIVAEQYNVMRPAARLFYFTASMFGVPVQGYHRYAETAASMRVKAAAIVPVVTASGREMTQSETVTLFNDMCLMAPATLIDPAIAWEPVDSHASRARFTHAGITIGAELHFDDRGDLVNFVSDDRYQAGSDGTPMTRTRWSTPVTGYHTQGAFRLPASGEGRWHDAEGDYAYIVLTIERVQYNVPPR
jgi:hypothetical protein